MLPKLPLAAFAATFCLLLAGCGSSLPSETCTAGNLTTQTYGSPDFTLALVNPAPTIYPGQTEQIAVSVNPVGSATGPVTVGAVSDIPGLTISSVTANIGSVANLTLTASASVAGTCFLGVRDVFTADRALKLTGTDAAGSVGTGVDLEVILENPSFTPSATNLPVLSINTTGAAPITSEDDYVTASMTIVDPTSKANNYTGTLGIKGHGNSTWEMPKKPYRLNLDSKAALLGMTSDSNWILLANYDDKTMLRNDVAFQMSTLIGMFWTPHSAFVELMLNGQYQGTYELTEKVEVSKARLNIGSIDPGDDSGTDLTGGYLGEIDHYKGQTLNFYDTVGLPIGLDDPDPPDAIQAAYWETAFDNAEAALYGPQFLDPATGWQSAWDETSMVKYFIVEELAGNQDANDWSSDYFYKPRSDPKFYRGPVWDMDVSFGNDNYGTIGSPNGPWVSTQARWYAQLFKDPVFLAAVKAQWQTIRPQMIALSSYIDTRAAALTLAAANNNGRWPTMGERVWPNTEATGSYTGEIAYMKAWLTDRISYMDSAYNQ